MQGANIVCHLKSSPIVRPNKPLNLRSSASAFQKLRTGIHGLASHTTHGFRPTR